MIGEYLKIYFHELFSLTNEMAPYLLLGFFFAGVLHVFFKKEKVARLLGSRKVKSSFYASLLGVPLPLCSCGVIPTGISIYKSGASKGSTVSFLISTPQTGFDSIMATYSMMGLPFAVLRPLIAFISGILGGSITNYIDRETPNNSTIALSETNDKANKNPLKSMLHYAFVESLQDIAKWLIIGLLIAALISVLLPPDFFQSYVNNDFLGMVIILLAAVPLYICATGSIPIAAVLLMKGISPGAALVFLMAGPATNAATITVIGKVMGRKTLTGYLVSIIGSALIFGLLIDNLLPREWFTSFVTYHHHGEHGLPYWLELSSTLILALLLVNIYSKKIRNKFISGSIKSDKIISATNDEVLEGYNTISVSGLDCNQCKSEIEKSIGLVSGVEWVEADIETSVVKVKTRGVNQSSLKNAIESSGHRYIGLFEKVNNSKMENVKIFVKGMTCNHCKANVENIIKSIQGISSVAVNLERSVVLIEGKDLNLNEIKEKIEGIGYEYGGLLN